MILRTIMAGVLSVAFISGCSQDSENPYQVEFSAPDYLIEHAKYLEEELFQIGDYPVWDYNTPNKGFGNVIMIEGDDGIIIIDTSAALDHAVVAREAFKDITSKPVKAIVYTHHHADHINGAAAFVNPEEAQSGAVKVIAAQNFLRELSDENQATAPIMGVRAMYMYGQLLDPDKEGQDYHVSCCGYQLAGGGPGYIAPNTFISDTQTMTIAGITVQFFQTGGESASHLAVYLPDQKILFTGDEIQGPTYPNLHSLRGTKPRDAQKWIDALDKMRNYEVNYLVPSHGQPVFGKTESHDLLTLYRDVIQYTHDQSIRYINKGYTPDELANSIKLPEHLDVDPWTREMYGTVKHNVREYYVAYISWWNGDPAELNPTPRLEQAKRYIELMGGRDTVFAEAERAFLDGDMQWASELSTLLIRVDNDDILARQLKAGALRAIGYATENTNWRGFYLTSALELEGMVDPAQVQQWLKAENFKPAQMTSAQLFNLLRFSVDADALGDEQLKIAFDITDTAEFFTLEFRNSILEIHTSMHGEADATISLSRDTLNKLFSNEISYDDAFSEEMLTLEGSKLALFRYGKALDTSLATPYLTVR